MSRIGRMPIPVPGGVQVQIESNSVTVKGPKGTLSRDFHPDMRIVVEDNQLRVERPTDQRQHRALHGLTRALLNNMVVGVTEGYERKLEIQGVGYRAEMQGTHLVLHLGFSHPVDVPPPPGVSFEVEPRTRVVTVRGVDKEVVGQVAAEIRGWRPPEPYLGKGVWYQGEKIRRKAGKAGKVK